MGRGIAGAALPLVVAVLALGAGACGDADEPEAPRFPADTTMGRLQDDGRIRIGVKVDTPPFGFRPAEGEEPQGFDVDLGRRVAAELGVEPEWVETVSDDRIPFLQDGTVDLVLSTMTITAERDREVDFSEPYFVARGRILVPRDSPVRGLAGLAGRRVCTARGSTYADTLDREAPRAELRLVASYAECLELVQNRAVDAVVSDDGILAGMILEDPMLTLVGEELTTEAFGAGIREGDGPFRRFVSSVVRRWKRDGGWARAYRSWIGRYTREPREPPALDVRQAIALSARR